MGVSMGSVYSGTKIKTLKFWYPVVKAKKVSRDIANSRIDSFSFVQNSSVKNMFSIKENVFIYEAQEFYNNGDWAIGERGCIAYITDNELYKPTSQINHAMVEITDIKFMDKKVQLLSNVVNELEDLSENFNCRIYKYLVDSLIDFYKNEDVECPLRLISEANYFNRRIQLSTAKKQEVIRIYDNLIKPIPEEELVEHESIIRRFIERGIDDELKPKYKYYFLKLIDVIKDKKTTLILDYNY